MRELPPEILSFIFTLVVDSNIFGRINHHRPRRIGASFLTKICSQWRAVALSTPEIWARISIEHDDSNLLTTNDMRLMKNRPARLKLCLERAQTFPLSVEASLYHPHAESDVDLITTEFITLLQELMRSDWEGLTVLMYSVPADTCKFITGIIAYKLGFLRRLEIDFRGMDDMEPLRAWQGLTTFPHLQSLRLSHSSSLPKESLTSFRTIDNLIFPYSQLTHININIEPTATEVLQILRLCSRRLRSAQIGSNFPPFYTRRNTEIISPFTLPLLNSLTIRTPYMTYIQQCVDTLTTPALKSLSMSCPPNEYLIDIHLSLLSQTLQNSLRRSEISGSLQKLHLSISGVSSSPSSEELIGLLRITTGLEELQLNIRSQLSDGVSENRASDFLRALTKDDTLIPKLKHFRIRCYDDFYTDNLPTRRAWLEEFEMMVAVRAAQALRTVILEIQSNSYMIMGKRVTRVGPVRDIDDALMERLRRLQERCPGLEVQVLKVW